MFPELQHYWHRIDDLRRQVGRLVADLPAEALNWRPLPQVDDHAMNSLAAMTAHIAGAEHFWIAEVVGGYPPTRDRAAEFGLVVDGPAPLLARLEAVEKETAAVFERLTPSDLEGTRIAHDKPLPVRWSILHTIDHSALHLGHMQITYQLWMGGRSMPSPRWFERLPKA
ncbi:MAG: DinB family protein [Caldilineales bacterium]|nr:DinB family protein [Caldilineales bacterium]